MGRLDAKEFARIAKALADPQRCEILERTAGGTFCCSALVEIFPLTQATVSHHLRELTEAGLLGRRKRGQLAYYFFRPERMEAYVEELSRRMRLAPTSDAAQARPASSDRFQETSSRSEAETGQIRAPRAAKKVLSSNGR